MEIRGGVQYYLNFGMKAWNFTVLVFYYGRVPKNILK